MRAVLPIYPATMDRIGPSASRAVFCLLAAAPIATQDKGTLQELLDRTAPLVQPLLDAKICVGLTVGMLRHGDSAVRGFGRVNKDSPQVPNGDTVYEIGSVSKVFHKSVKRRNSFESCCASRKKRGISI